MANSPGVEAGVEAGVETGRKRTAGRRAGADSGTRAAILAAAREQFATKGYDGASLRTIAASAGVDPGLIRHFYGAKDDLFTAALDVPDDVSVRLRQALDDQPHELGERLVRAYLQQWEDPATAEPILAILRSALTSERAADRLRSVVGVRMMRDIVPFIAQDNAEIRIALAGAHLMGVAVQRFVVRIDPLASLDRETLIALWAPTIQRYLTGPLPRANG